jgi:hypothetical protein
MEMDKEVFGSTGTSYTAEFWQYDSRIGRRWNLDPKPNPAISQYATFALNPIWYSDVLGDTLKVSQDLQSTSDISSLVKSENSKFLRFNISDMSVSLDFGNEDIVSLLSNDEGLSLIYDLVNAKENILYEATDIVLHKKEDGSKAHSVMGFGFTNDGVANMSNFGADSGGEHFMRPRDGYDGQVSIAKNAEFSEWNGSNHVQKQRSTVVFHELAENYLRTHFKISYHPYNNCVGAHNGAVLREMNWNNKSIRPGELSKLPTVNINRSSSGDFLNIIDNYYKN